MESSDREKKKASQDNDDSSNQDKNQVRPVPFFATIHHDHYEPGEIEEINRKLFEQYQREEKQENNDDAKNK